MKGELFTLNVQFCWTNGINTGALCCMYLFTLGSVEILTKKMTGMTSNVNLPSQVIIHVSEHLIKVHASLKHFPRLDAQQMTFENIDEKEKFLIMSNFSFCHNVFNSI